MRVYCVLEREDTFWTIPGNMAIQQETSTVQDHVPFVYLTPEEVEDPANEDSWLEAAARKTYDGGSVCPDDYFLVMEVRGSHTVKFLEGHAAVVEEVTS